MSNVVPDETRLTAEIDRLKVGFPKTRAAREVCALLFFRFAITPTANRLYLLVKRGSMSGPRRCSADSGPNAPENPRTHRASGPARRSRGGRRRTGRYPVEARHHVSGATLGALQSVAAARDELGRIEATLRFAGGRAGRGRPSGCLRWRNTRASTGRIFSAQRCTVA
ncbi:hypothetical protein OKW30_006000 [Paraburkholderia sp. Clong3]